MRINRLSLLNSLFSVLNDNSPEDSNAMLARYFLQNYRNLASLNIFDVAADCYVSRSSVRRFCKALGYENFVDLKNEFIEYDDKMTQSMAHFHRSDYRIQLTSEINAMIEELDRRMNNEQTMRIAERIHDSRFVVFLTSDTSTSVIKMFQQAMVLQGKIIYLVSDTYTEQTMLTQLDERDYVITVSVTGVFAKAIAPYVRDMRATKHLVTANRDQKLHDGYDKVYHLSATDKSEEGSLVYGKYGINYMFDVILATYINRYAD